MWCRQPAVAVCVGSATAVREGCRGQTAAVTAPAIAPLRHCVIAPLRHCACFSPIQTRDVFKTAVVDYLRRVMIFVRVCVRARARVCVCVCVRFPIAALTLRLCQRRLRVPLRRRSALDSAPVLRCPVSAAVVPWLPCVFPFPAFPLSLVRLTDTPLPPFHQVRGPPSRMMTGRMGTAAAGAGGDGRPMTSVTRAGYTVRVWLPSCVWLLQVRMPLTVACTECAVLGAAPHVGHV